MASASLHGTSIDGSVTTDSDPYTQLNGEASSEAVTTAAASLHGTSIDGPVRASSGPSAVVGGGVAAHSVQADIGDENVLCAYTNGMRQLNATDHAKSSRRLTTFGREQQEQHVAHKQRLQATPAQVEMASERTAWDDIRDQPPKRREQKSSSPLPPPPPPTSRLVKLNGVTIDMEADYVWQTREWILQNEQHQREKAVESTSSDSDDDSDDSDGLPTAVEYVEPPPHYASEWDFNAHMYYVDFGADPPATDTGMNIATLAETAAAKAADHLNLWTAMVAHFSKPCHQYDLCHGKNPIMVHYSELQKTLRRADLSASSASVEHLFMCSLSVETHEHLRSVAATELRSQEWLPRDELRTLSLQELHAQAMCAGATVDEITAIASHNINAVGFTSERQGVFDLIIAMRTTFPQPPSGGSARIVHQIRKLETQTLQKREWHYSGSPTSSLLRVAEWDRFLHLSDYGVLNVNFDKFVHALTTAADQMQEIDRLNQRYYRECSDVRWYARNMIHKLHDRNVNTGTVTWRAVESKEFSFYGFEMFIEHMHQDVCSVEIDHCDGRYTLDKLVAFLDGNFDSGGTSRAQPTRMSASGDVVSMPDPQVGAKAPNGKVTHDPKHRNQLRSAPLFRIAAVRPLETFLQEPVVSAHTKDLVGVNICHGLKAGQRLLKVVKLSKRQKQYVHGAVIHSQLLPGTTNGFEITAVFKGGSIHRGRLKKEISQLISWRTVWTQHETAKPNTPPFDLTYTELCEAWNNIDGVDRISMEQHEEP
jgi:hypothetical protein